MKKQVYLGIVVAMMLALATPAAAKQPIVVYEGPYEETVPVADCGDFTALAHTVGYARIENHLDNTGTPIRMQAHASGFDHIYNTSNPSKFVEGSFAWNAKQDLPDGNMVRSGLFWHFVAPGYGNVYMETGVWTLVDGQWIRHSGLAEYQHDALCEVLR